MGIVFNFIKGIVLWVCNNQGASLEYVRKAMYVAKIASQFTPTSKDDKSLKFLADQVEKCAKFIPDPEQKKKFIEAIDRDKSTELNNVNLNFDTSTNEVHLDVKGVTVDWNPSNGSIKAGVGFRI